MSENKTSAAQLRAAQKYKREKVKRVTVEFSPAEAELWEHIQGQPNKQGYIKGLIRADMEKEAGCELCRSIQHIRLFDDRLDCFITDQMEHCPHCGRKIRKAGGVDG